MKRSVRYLWRKNLYRCVSIIFSFLLSDFTLQKKPEVLVQDTSSSEESKEEEVEVKKKRNTIAENFLRVPGVLPTVPCAACAARL